MFLVSYDMKPRADDKTSIHHLISLSARHTVSAHIFT